MSRELIGNGTALVTPMPKTANGSRATASLATLLPWRSRQARSGDARQVCGLDFEKAYADLHERHFECHHQNPLSERTEENQPQGITAAIDKVAIACANNHWITERKHPEWCPDCPRSHGTQTEQNGGFPPNAVSSFGASA